MLLLIDAGNTRIKWAVIHDRAHAALGVWDASGVITHQQLREIAPWHDLPLQAALISNVAGLTVRTDLAASLPANIQVDWFQSQATAAGVRNHYRQPERLGCDRFASALAAHALFPGQDLIVATCGTATTIDAVGSDGDFYGGMIVPGLKLMAQSLAVNTAQLPSLEATMSDAGITATFADNTEAAILSGCLTAQAGAIEFAARNFPTGAQPGSAALPLCLLSGGAARFVQPRLRIPHQLIDNLVMTGLQVYSRC